MSQIIKISNDIKIKIEDSISYDVDYQGEIDEEAVEFNVSGNSNDTLYDLSYNDDDVYELITQDNDNYVIYINEISFPTIYIYYRNSLVLSVSGLKISDFYCPIVSCFAEPEGGVIICDDINIHNKSVSYIKEAINYIFGKLFNKYIFDDFDSIFEDEFEDFTKDVITYISQIEDDDFDEDVF